MKKYFIILLAVLLLFTFTSCKDKSAEVEAEYKEKLAAQEAENESIVKNYEDFWDAYDIAEQVWKIYKLIVSGNGELNLAETAWNTSSSGYNIYYPGKIFLGLKDGETTSGGIYVHSASGTVTTENYGTGSFDSNKDITFTNNALEIKYRLEDDTEDRTVNASLSGTLSVKVDTVNKTEKYTINITINGEKEYKASWTLDTSTNNYKYTEATVNGKEVELKLLNKVAPSWG